MTAYRKKCHALTPTLELMCGRIKGANRTSIVRSPKDILAKLVTCKRCLRKLRS
jgi:hypothetical protein